MTVILRELYDENVLPLMNISLMSSKPDAVLEHWMLELFGEDSTLSVQGKEDYLERWLVYFLTEKNGRFHDLWKTGKLNASLILGLLNRTPSLCKLWLQKIGDERLRVIYRNWSAVYAALRSRFAELGFLRNLAEYLSIWMVELTEKRFLAWSETEIIHFLAARIKRNIPPGLAGLLGDIHWDKSNSEDILEIINQINELKEEMEDGMEKKQVSVNNAGMLLVQVFFPRLFHMVNYMEKDCKKFKDEDSQIRAVFLLQYLVYGEEKEYSEEELYLNRVLVNLDADRPLPRSCKLNELEIKTVDLMIDTVKKSWDKISHISDRALRETFFQRKGVVLYDGREPARWVVTVEEKAYDVLLSSIPWGYSMYRYPWMNEIVEVKWR